MVRGKRLLYHLFGFETDFLSTTVAHTYTKGLLPNWPFLSQLRTGYLRNDNKRVNGLMTDAV